MAQLRGRERARYVTGMFARISPRYDLLNTVMTAGRHHAWRKVATKLAVADAQGPTLDVATGTGDFALELAFTPAVSHVVGLDFTPEMLALAELKARRRHIGDRLSLVVGDAHALPFPDDYFICATVGFGIRNFVDLPLALGEMARVVRPGGRVVTLEIVRMDGGGPLRVLFPLLFRHITPWLGAALAGDREAYTYLPESVGEFISAGQLAGMMEAAGLRVIVQHKLALGSVAIHVGQKQ